MRGSSFEHDFSFRVDNDRALGNIQSLLQYISRFSQIPWPPPSIVDELQLFRSSANPVRPFELASMVVGDEVVSALEGSERSTSCDSSDP